jgi:ATP-dependent helicase/nuclease subunit B
MVRVSTILAGVPFVDALAAGLLGEAGADPLALADMLVLLPNRRACRSLHEAFLRVEGGRALILPQIQPFGDIEDDALLLDGTLEAGLPPAIGDLRRRLLLAKLLGPLGYPVDQAFRLAAELARLLDELQEERVSLAALDGAVPDGLAEHWEHSRRLLAILEQAWPAILEERGLLDRAERRHRLLTALAARWQTDPPAQRIVAVGWAGSSPATRALLRAIARLPRGEVVLPGLDRELDEVAWQAITPSHPQAGLAELLDALGVERSAVGSWQGVPAATPGARVQLLSELMRPSASLDAWPATPLLPDSLAGLTLATHPDPGHEARAIALRLRAVLAAPAATAALVTPDRQLARRVAAELRRWRIEIDDSAGIPLDRTAPGSFLLLTARLAIDGVTPVALLAALKHPFARAGLARAEFRRRVCDLERLCLRGPRIASGFQHILEELKERQRDPRLAGEHARLAALQGWLAKIAALAHPLVLLGEAGREAGLADLADAHLRFAEALAAGPADEDSPLWRHEAGELAAELMGELLEAAGEAAPLVPAAYPPLLAQILAERPVRPARRTPPRLFIWGQLEARLQQADLVILAGLNEGTWPAAAEPGPWLNRRMREVLGLPAVEHRIGQAAHDFVEAAAAPEVVLSRALKDAQGNPTVPCRWLVRLDALLAGAGLAIEHAPDWLAWADRLDVPATPPRPLAQPRPSPPLAARPRAHSVSDIRRWLQDAYEFYARRLLRLAELDALEAEPGALERGTLLHEVLEAFVRAHPQALPADALSQIEKVGQRAFARFRHRPQVRALWWPRFLAIARWLVEAEAEFRPQIESVLAEVKGSLILTPPGGPVELHARADRIERHPDGTITIVDYKTGSLPSKAELEQGQAPQLPLEALIALRGAFDGVAADGVAALRFWQLSGKAEGGAQKDTRLPAAELAALAEAGLMRLLAHYDRPEAAYPPRFMPKVAPRTPFQHLARLDEWAS